MVRQRNTSSLSPILEHKRQLNRARRFKRLKLKADEYNS